MTSSQEPVSPDRSAAPSAPSDRARAAGAGAKRRVRLIALFTGILIPAVVLVVGIVQQGTPFDATRPPADAEPGRWMWLEGAQNTRDIGGYRTTDGKVVKRGLVYRSGTLSHLTEAGCKAFRDLGIVTVVDFRNRLLAVPLYNGDVLGVFRAASVYGCPMSFKRQKNPQDTYIVGWQNNPDSFRRTFELLADRSHLPLLYHCQAGKDRTGVMTALLLTLLGVDRQTVLADFRLTDQVSLPGNVLAINHLLDEVQAGGGIEAFLAKAGITPEIQAKIRELLLEDPKE